MPKVELSAKEALAKKRYNYVAAMMAAGFRQKCMETSDISKKTGIPERTVTERMRHPERIRLEDLYAFADAAGIKIRFELAELPE